MSENSPSKRELAQLSVQDMINAAGITVPDEAFEKMVDHAMGTYTISDLTKATKRNSIKNVIVERLHTGEPLDLKAVAKDCGVTDDLARHILRDIQDEYPAMTATPAKFRVMLPKQKRAQELMENMFLAAGFELVGKRKDGLLADKGFIIDNRKEIEPIPVLSDRVSNIIPNLKTGDAQYVFLGNDKIHEIVSKQMLGGNTPTALDILGQFKENSFRMCILIAQEEKSWAESLGTSYLQNKSFVTSFPATTERYLKENNIRYKSIEMSEGKVELYARKNGMLAVDIVETGNSIRHPDIRFAVFDKPIYEGNVTLFNLTGANIPSEDRARMNIVNRRLQAGEKALQNAA